MRMRTGKTRVALGYCYGSKCKRILVVAPLSAVPGWEKEYKLITFGLPLVDLTTRGSVKDKAFKLKQTRDAIVLINYESYWRKPLRDQILKWTPDAVILDEAHRIRHRGARQSRYAHTLGERDHVRVKLALTGTPVTNGLQDIWSIYRFLDRSTFGTYLEFENEYIIKGGFEGREIKGYKNEDKAEQIIADSSYQWEGSFPVPEDVAIPVRLTPGTQKVYKELAKKAITEVVNAQGESRVVVARIVLTLLIRLQQISCGFVRDVGEDLIEISQEKGEAAIDLITDALAGHEKVIVFCRFLHDLDLLQRLAPKHWRVGRMDGAADKKKIRADFEAGKLDVIFAQTRTASLGVDFSNASVGIFFSVSHSLDEFIQAKARMDGYNQQKNVIFYHLIATPTDEQIYKALKSKTRIAERLTDLHYAFELLGGKE